MLTSHIFITGFVSLAPVIPYLAIKKHKKTISCAQRSKSFRCRYIPQTYNSTKAEGSKRTVVAPA